MSLDFDALRKKLNTLQGQNDRKSALWKPPEGSSIVRLVPWKERADNPFIELYFHYLGRKTHLSPITHGKPDPIAEFADKLRSTGDKDDWNFSKQFSPKLRTFVPIIVRGEEDKGVRFWGFGKMVYTELLQVINDEDWGDISDPQSGHDVSVDFIPEKKSDTAYAQTKCLVKPKETPLSKDAEQVKKWLTEQPDIDEIFEEPSYEELATFLEKFLTPEGGEDTSVTATTKGEASSAEAVVEDKPEVKTAKVKTKAKTASAVEETDEGNSSDVAEEFEKLFNE